MHTTFNFTQKGFIIAVLIFSITILTLPGRASAETMEELQAEIAKLLNEIGSLNTELDQAKVQVELAESAEQFGSENSICPFTWNRNLTLDTEGNDVFKLQQFLNASADTKVATEGAGAPGSETTYYGYRTAEAVSKFQVKYKSEILVPNDLTAPTAFFGPSTRAKINSLCVAAPASANAGADKTSVSSSDTKAKPLSGSASLEDFDASSGRNTSLKEAQNEASIMNAEFTVENGDVILNRIEVVFEHIKGTEDDPWDIFDKVSLWSERKKFAEEDTSEEDNWSDDSPYNGAHTVRFSGLDIRINEDETFEFIVAVDTQDDIRNIGDGLSWEVFIPDDGIRALDADRASNFIGDRTDEVDIVIK